jgi:hypothetical protein
MSASMGAMEPDANPSGPSAEDLAALARYAMALADGVEAGLPGWVVGTVRRVHLAQTGAAAPAEVLADAEQAGRAAAADIGPRVRALLATDIDEQSTNPLSIVRTATRYPTEVLQRAGVAPVDRDVTAQRQFPDDVYDVTPAFFADLDPELHEPGLVWGAAKAHVHLARRRAEGRR